MCNLAQAIPLQWSWEFIQQELCRSYALLGWMWPILLLTLLFGFFSWLIKTTVK